MTTLCLLPRAVPAPSPYEPWYRHFLDNRRRPRPLPWEDAYRLSAAERGAVVPSIRQFQLGEWGSGRGLLRRAAAHPVLGADAWFRAGLELFVAEEQGHSELLGRFLDLHGIPRLPVNWVDAAFRRLRKLAGLEACATVLVTAEVLAVPFYQALRDATRSPLLRALCRQILCDEAAHLQYQALTLGLARRALDGRARRVRALAHALLFRGTALLVWREHRRVFRAAGWPFGRFWSESRREFARLEARIARARGDAPGVEALRLD